MSRYKSQKQAYLIAALVILLCLVCLSGATLALFTSNKQDGTIGIVTTSGNINVDIVDVTGVSLKNDTLDFRRGDETVTALFEPGATFRTEGFQVKNTGNISIRFRLHISNDENMDMEEFNRAFEVRIGTDPNDPGKGVLMTDFSQVILPGVTDGQIYYLFVHMKEEAGNEFQGAVYSGIGVTVYAVQGNADVENVKTGA